MSDFFELDRMSTSKLCFLEKAAKPENHMEVIFRAVPGLVSRATA
jgi:hypothetical protein